MWDDRLKVGVLNGFGSARLTDEEDIDERNSRGAIPFLALDLTQRNPEKERPRRRYRHDAESFAWSLIYLYQTTIEDEDGENCTRDPNTLKIWSDGWHSLAAKLYPSDRAWSPGPNAVYPCVRELAHWLHGHWTKRYYRQNDHVWKLVPKSESQPYEEMDDEEVFLYLLANYEEVMGSQELFDAVKENLIEMRLKYLKADWSG